MDNYIVELNIYEESELFGTVVFKNNQTLNTMGQFDIDMQEITRRNLSFNQYLKLCLDDKKKIMIDFINNIENNNNCQIYFVMNNGEKSIRFSNNLLEFTISSMTMRIQFAVVICPELINQLKNMIK
jgi:hypothetical protein